MKAFLLAICLFSLAGMGWADTIPVVKLVPERLPDMSVPRSGHGVFFAGGELTVSGGHTTGFVPTPTTEYYDGAWHTVTMVYPHDNGLFVPLRSGRVLLCGGHSEPLGIGQTFVTEWYDPATHTFTGFGCLDTKRSLAQGIEIDSNRVVIAGNHYHKDNIELFDGRKFFAYAKDAAVERGNPLLYRMSNGDVGILGGWSTRYQPHGSTLVDRLHGEPFHAPLLEQWQPLLIPDVPYDSNNCLIGDTTAGDYSYLFPVVGYDPTMTTYEAVVKCNAVAIAVARDTLLALLPTDHDVPMTVDGRRVCWFGSVVADRQAERAYLLGFDSSDNCYILCIDYSDCLGERGRLARIEEHEPLADIGERGRLARFDERERAGTGSAPTLAGKPARLTLYEAGHHPDMGHTVPILTPDGNLLVIGGISFTHDNFDPLSTVWLLRVNGETKGSTGGSPATGWHGAYPYIGVLLLLIAVAAWLLLRRHRSASSAEGADRTADVGAGHVPARQPHPSADEPSALPPADVPSADEPSALPSANEELMARIDDLVIGQQLYLDSNMNLSNVATRLGVNRNTVSACVNSQRGCSFSHYVSSLRIDYAKNLMRTQPGIKISEVWSASGFSNEATFFRTFKALTDMTPREWINA